MFSLKEKQMIAQIIEEALLSLRHPEMPAGKVEFRLHVDGKEPWSWADIEPNWKYEKVAPTTSDWNENARLYMGRPLI